VAWTIERGSPYLCTPLAYRGVLYVLASNGVVALYDAVTGARLSQQRLSTGVGYSASPVGSGGHVYFTNDDGEVTVVRAGRTFEIVGRNQLGAMTFATPAVTRGALIFRTVTGLVAIGEQS
jgi:outer membrane protein assembly factor BamB